MPDSATNPYAPPKKDVRHIGAKGNGRSPRYFALLNDNVGNRFLIVVMTPLPLLMTAAAFNLISNYELWRAAWAILVGIAFLMVPFTKFANPSLPKSMLWLQSVVVAFSFFALGCFDILMR